MGDEQGWKVPASILHSKVELASLDAKRKLGLTLPLSAAGLSVNAVFGHEPDSQPAGGVYDTPT